jgi:hypothetical protein
LFQRPDSRRMARAVNSACHDPHLTRPPNGLSSPPLLGVVLRRPRLGQGRGKKLRWLTAQLKSGKRIDDFRIDLATA